ncbi:MAG TPA: phospholipase D-like domain-containing protein [Burkholderiaceae bacterium]|nr:phospholipase D-like domain-containing protein [Burkholderiaceae bacterium]
MRSVIFTAHNNVTLLHCGAEYFPALIATIDAAQVEVFLETYIFAADETGTQVKDALVRAAARGVTVNVVTDWLGTGRQRCNALYREFLQTRVNYRIFNPWFRRGVARTHRKICVVDREVAFLGGLNINDDLRSDDDPRIVLPAPRWDFAVKISGPLVYDIHLEADAQWARSGPLNFKTRWELFREVRSTLETQAEGPALAGLVVRDNLRNRRTIQRAYLKALGMARKNALLANPYFAPGRKLRDALASAAGRGVDVTLLLGVGQFRLQDAVTHSFYPKLLKAGVKIVEYRKTQLHGKVAVVDSNWATVGSSNYDGFSLFVNQEANIVVKDETFSNALRAHIEHGVAEGVPIDPACFANIPWYKRAWHGAAYLIYKGVLRIITAGKYVE